MNIIILKRRSIYQFCRNIGGKNNTRWSIILKNKFNGYVIVQSPHIYDILMFLYGALFLIILLPKMFVPVHVNKMNFIIR